MHLYLIDILHKLITFNLAGEYRMSPRFYISFQFWSVSKWKLTHNPFLGILQMIRYHFWFFLWLFWGIEGTFRWIWFAVWTIDFQPRIFCLNTKIDDFVKSLFIRHCEEQSDEAIPSFRAVTSHEIASLCSQWLY